MYQKLRLAKTQEKTIKIVSLLIVMVLLVSVLPQFTRAAFAATCSKSYTVVAGDTLSSIAAKYNTTVQVLAQLNDLKEPYVLSVGQVICLPADAKITTTTPSSSSSSSGKYKYEMTVSRDGTRITLKSSSFPPKSNFIVRVGEKLRHSSWTRIGKLRTDKNGTGSAIYGLPKDFRNLPSYYICLKNQVTDKVTCNKVFQTVVNPKATAKPTAKPTATPKP